MNQLIYQKNELLARFGNEATLGHVFSEIENDLRKLDKVVCQFMVNGLVLDENAEKRLAGASLEEVETLAVKSETPIFLLEGILENWVKKLPELVQMADDLSLQIRLKGMDGQLKALVDLIDEAQLLVESIISIDMVFSQMPKVSSDSWKKAQKHMATGVGEALQAFEKKDFNTLADIIEYDLGHSFQTWKELLESLRQDVQKAKPSAT